MLRKKSSDDFLPVSLSFLEMEEEMNQLNNNDSQASITQTTWGSDNKTKQNIMAWNNDSNNWNSNATISNNNTTKANSEWVAKDRQIQEDERR